MDYDAFTLAWKISFLLTLGTNSWRPGAGRAGDHGPQIFRNRWIFRNLKRFCRKSFGLLLLVKIKVSNFIGKSLNLSPYSTGATGPLLETPWRHYTIGPDWKVCSARWRSSARKPTAIFHFIFFHFKNSLCAQWPIKRAECEKYTWKANNFIWEEMRGRFFQARKFGGEKFLPRAENKLSSLALGNAWEYQRHLIFSLEL